MSWSPTPGTIPALAVDHLMKMPFGTRLPTVVLADAIGHDAGSLAAYLAPAKSFGWLRSEKRRSDRSHEWWLGPDAPVHPDELDAVRSIKGAIAECLAHKIDSEILSFSRSAAPAAHSVSPETLLEFLSRKRTEGAD